MRILFVIVFLPCIEMRVAFKHSLFLDTQDLFDESATPFKCRAGCRLFSPTLNSHLVITTSDGAEIVSLAQISSKREVVMTGFELKACGSIYYLVNKGAARPRFLLYVVQNTAGNQATPIYFINSNFVLTIDINQRYATVISDVSRFVVRDFTGNYTVDRPAVYTVGFDAVDSSSCNPVYRARNDQNVKATTFYVNGPLATIDFGSINAHSITVSSRDEPLPAVNFVGSVVYASPGYVGCPSALGHYYSPVTSMNAGFAKGLIENRIIFDFVADYQINSLRESLHVTVNNEELNLYGYGRTSRQWESNSIVFNLNWKKINDRSSSAFAVQIDMSKEQGNSFDQSSILFAFIVILMFMVRE